MNYLDMTDLEEAAQELFFNVIYEGDRENVKHLAPEHKHSTDMDGNSGLHIASGRKDTTVAKILLDAGYNPNGVNLAGEVPLHEAARSGNYEMCMLLIEHAADVNGLYGGYTTPLTKAILECASDCVELLLRNKADANFVDGCNCTPLHTACCEQSKTREANYIVQLLLKYNADPNPVVSDSKSPLWCAISMGGNEFAVKSLLQLPLIDTSGLEIDKIIKSEKISRAFYTYQVSKMTRTFLEFCKKGKFRRAGSHPCFELDEIRRIIFKQLLLSSEFPLTKHRFFDPQKTIESEMSDSSDSDDE